MFQLSATSRIGHTLRIPRGCNVLPTTKSRLPLASAQVQCRLSSTSSPLPLKVPSTSGDNFTGLSQKELRSPPHRTKKLDQIAGEEWTAKAKGIEADTKQLVTDLNKIFAGLRRLGKTLEYRDFHVRTGALNKDLTHAVTVDLGDVIIAGKKIPNIWLRDNCQCSSCVHESTKQRLLDTFSIPKDLYMKNHSISENKEVLSVEWSDGHKSEYTRPWLSATVRSEQHRVITRQGLTRLATWGAEIADRPPTVLNDENLTVKDILRPIRKFGFVFIDGVDHPNPTATKALLEKIAFIRETHYGGFYDFTADLASQDTAYTNIALEAHTDNTYFSDPAGLQAFHLLSHTDGSGGASLLVDGFKVALELQQTDREAYKVLSTVDVNAHASGNEGISIQPYRGFPVLEHDPATGDLLRVRWNNSDRASIGLPIDETERWYDAARKWDALVKKRENEFWEQLKPGRVLIFDNWRVLHGRSAFTGKRRICGGYVNRDDWISKYKMEEWGRERVLKDLASG